MKHKTDKNHFDHQRHFAHFLWASNRGRQLYDMSIVQDDKKLGFQKKKPSLKKNLKFEKKHPEFWKHLSFFLKKPWVLKKSEFYKKTHEFWKNLSFKKCFKINFKKKTWALTKEKMIGLKIKPQTWNNKFYHSNFPK